METYRDILEHHGIKGMRWGVRRYRNYDGTLTAAGKRRQRIDEAKNDLKESKKRSHDANAEWYRNSPRMLIPSKKNREILSEKNKIAQEAYYDTVMKKAALTGAKKKQDKNVAKAELNSLAGEMSISNRVRREGLYNHISNTKGKDYANQVKAKSDSYRRAQTIAVVTAATYTLGKAAYKRYSNQIAERNNFRKSVDAALGIWEGKNSKALTSPLNVRYMRETYPSTTKKMTDSAVQKLSNYTLNDLKDLDLY